MATDTLEYKIRQNELLSFSLENQSAYLEWVRTSILLFGFGLTIFSFTEGKFWTIFLILVFSILFLVEGYISFIDNRKAIIDQTYAPRSFITINFWLVIILYLALIIVVYRDRGMFHPITFGG